MNKRRVQLRVESLENLTLLSTLPALPGLATGATGLGGIGSASVTDAQSLQQDSSGGSLEQYISQIETLYGKRANVKAFAQSVIANHGVTNYDLQNVASQVGVTLPPGISLPADIQGAQKVLAAVKHGNVDSAYLKEMTQINAQDIADDVQLIQSTQVGSISLYAQETAAYDQNHLHGALGLTRSPKSTYSPTFATTSISLPIGAGSQGTASSSDTQALQMDESGGALEVFISQVEGQAGKRSDAQQYAQTVVADHQATNYDLQATAVGTGVTLPSGITDPMDIQDAKRVLAASRGDNLDAVYLQVMEEINSQDITADQQLSTSTQNARIKAYAQETLSFDQTHLSGAQTLRSMRSLIYSPSGSNS